MDALSYTVLYKGLEHLWVLVPGTNSPVDSKELPSFGGIKVIGRYCLCSGLSLPTPSSHLVQGSTILTFKLLFSRFSHCSMIKFFWATLFQLFCFLCSACTEVCVFNQSREVYKYVLRISIQRNLSWAVFKDGMISLQILL